ncbi:MAG: hypothetical protein HBSAPP02_21690 [Phycisphaerae bacterium]|nr:MAG: hypothetical protein HBSAPP02_21690 [Phycisphaerae bacterium]
MENSAQLWEMAVQIPPSMRGEVGSMVVGAAQCIGVTAEGKQAAIGLPGGRETRLSDAPNVAITTVQRGRGFSPIKSD